MAVTLLAICQEIARRLAAYESGTATGGTASAVICASSPFINPSANADSNKYVGVTIMPTAGTALGQERVIYTYAPTTGTLTPDSAFTAAATTFDIYKRGITYTDIKNAVNEALRRSNYRCISPLTLVPDGDMEASGVSNWTASNCVSSKVTTSSNLFEGRRGAQCLYITGLGYTGSGYVYSANIPVIENESYYLQARVMGSAFPMTVTMSAYDATNAAQIDADDAWDEYDWGVSSLTFTIPSNCKIIQVRFTIPTGGALSYAYIDDVILHRIGATEVLLPDWITKESQIEQVVYTPSGADEADADTYYAAPGYIIPDEMNTYAPFKFMSTYTLSDPHFIIARRPYAELSATSDTTNCEKDYIIQAGLVTLLDTLINRGPSQETQAWKAEWTRQARRLRYMTANRSHTPIKWDIRW